MTAQKTGTQHLQDALDARSDPPFEGSGCSDHVTRRNLNLSVAGALLALVVLIAVLLL